MVRRNVEAGRLFFTTDIEESVHFGQIQFIAVGTPPDEDGSADLQYVVAAARNIGRHMTDYKLVVDKSTVPVGTADKVRAALQEELTKRGVALEFTVASNPEFLKEGAAVDDFMKPDRVVVGTRSQRAKKLMSDLYAPFVRQGNPVIFMDERSSELTKYAANSFLATKISFMNEIAQLCERMGADVDMVRRGIGSDDRIGKRFLFPGIGYGGSCFPKDVQALVQSSSEVQYDFEILKAVEKVNANQKLHLVEKIKAYFKNDLQGKHFALWGLAFKPNTDDIREAPALSIIDALTSAGATVTAYDPEAMPNVKGQIGDKIQYAANQYEALQNAAALIIATEWSEFRTPDFERMEQELKHKIIFDGRNLFDVAKMNDLGYHYESIGRADSNQVNK
jgi:UDPglucose 6-dehydrogenase